MGLEAHHPLQGLQDPWAAEWGAVIAAETAHGPDA